MRRDEFVEFFISAETARRILERCATCREQPIRSDEKAYEILDLLASDGYGEEAMRCAEILGLVSGVDEE